MNNVAESESAESTTSSSLFRPSILRVESTSSHPPNGFPVSKGISAPTFTLGSTSTTPIQQPSNLTEVKDNKKVSPDDYVFGSNISSRVVNADLTQGASEKLLGISGDDNISENSVFTVLAKAVTSTTSNDTSSTLEDSANKLEEVHKNSTLNLQEVEVFTGEEGEVPIFRGHCRAYLFNNEKRQWNVLGASYFHLNDVKLAADEAGSSSEFRSRIVVRLSTTKRVVLNTSVWSKIPVALVDSRSLRIATIDEKAGHIKTFLFKFSEEENASKIYDALIARKEQAELREKKRPAHSNDSAARKRPAVNPACEVETKVPHITGHLASSSHSSVSKSDNTGSTSTKSQCVPQDPSECTLLTRTFSEVNRSQFQTSIHEPITKQLEKDSNTLLQVHSGGCFGKSSVENESHDSPQKHHEVLLPATAATLSVSKTLAADLLQTAVTTSSLDFSNLPHHQLDWSKSCDVVKVTCLLYSFDINKLDWEEPKQVILQMQELEGGHSRLIALSPSQSNPLVLAPVTGPMSARRTDPTSLLIAAVCFYRGFTDDSAIDIETLSPASHAFLLVLSSANEGTLLYDALVSRIDSPAHNETVEQSAQPSRS